MTPEERWEQGIEHSFDSLQIKEFIEQNDEHGVWQFGGDGDNGEDLLYLLDCYFADKAVQVRKIPVLAAERYGNKLTVYCPYCKRTHIHGGSSGHRVAHCSPDGLSPFLKTGYIVDETAKENQL